MKKLMQILSYILVAAAASAVTITALTLGQPAESYRKLDQLTEIIEQV
jgi:hypothetical protein